MAIIFKEINQHDGHGFCFVFSAFILYNEIFNHKCVSEIFFYFIYIYNFKYLGK